MNEYLLFYSYCENSNSKQSTSLCKKQWCWYLIGLICNPENILQGRMGKGGHFPMEKHSQVTSSVSRVELRTSEFSFSTTCYLTAMMV